MNMIRLYLIIFFICISISSYSQAPEFTATSSLLPDSYYSRVDKKISSLNEQLTKKSLKYLAKFQKQERKLQRKIEQLDEGNVTNIFAGAAESYNEFSEKIKSKTADGIKTVNGEYNPYLDSLGAALSFLEQFDGTSDKVKEPLASFNELQNKLQQSEKIKEFITERKNEVKELLSKYAKIPGSFKKEYDKLNKTAYYYSAQVKEYKEMLKDPKKIEQKALSILKKLPAFQKFMMENGQLASLFRIPGNYGMAQNLTGLQTRSSVQALIQQQISAGGPNAMAVVQQNIAQAANELNMLKDKVNMFGGGNSDTGIPDFKPNNQKTKKFLQRLEYATDLQFVKTDNLLPSTANIGLGIGYKLNDKSVIGIGMSYKMGMGSIQHISFTHQGMGLRSYAEYEIKGSLFMSGGYEMNYNAAFKNMEQLKDCNAWQRSALIGMSRKYKISKKVKGEMKLLYDFLANNHRPVTQPVIFRVGYSIK